MITIPDTWQNESFVFWMHNIKMKTINKDYICTCRVCGTEFNNNQEYLEHHDAHHN